MILQSTSQTSQRESFLDFLPNFFFFMTVTFTSETCKAVSSLFSQLIWALRKKSFNYGLKGTFQYT